MLRALRLLALLPLIFAACSARRSAITDEPLRRIVLESPPIWNAAVTWDHEEERLLMLDPGNHRLLSYSREGRLVAGLDLDPIAALDYSTPIRIAATRDGYLLGGRRLLLRVDRDLEGGQAIDLFAQLTAGGIEDGFLNDFVAAGNEILGFADYQRATEGWRRGFVRIDLDGSRLVSLHELPLDDQEFSRYYFYDRRPYVAALGKRVLALRYTEPAAVHRFGRNALEHLFTADKTGSADTGNPEALVAHSLHTWQRNLYLLLASTDPDARAAELVEAGLSRDEVQARLKTVLGEDAADGGKTWVLRVLDPKSGRVLDEYVLPSRAERLHLVPGERHWALVEETRPRVERPESALSVLLIPSSRIPG